MSRLPTFKQLHHLVTLFEHQHFGKAADACFVSQSTMSASIAQLEETLDVQLLERDHKSFIFTPMGEAVVKQSRDILQKGQDLLDYVHSEGRPMHGSLRVGCIPTITPFMMSDLISSSSKKYPNLKLLVREDTTDNLLNLLEIGQIDVIILALPYPTRNFHVEILSSDPFHLVLPKSLVGKINVHKVNSWPDESIFFLEKEHCLTGHALKACALENNKKINSFFASSLHTLIQMVSSNKGLTYLPQLAINSGILTNTDLTTIAQPNTSHRQIAMLWRETSQKKESYYILSDLTKELLTRLLMQHK